MNGLIPDINCFCFCFFCLFLFYGVVSAEVFFLCIFISSAAQTCRLNLNCDIFFEWLFNNLKINRTKWVNKEIN